MGFYTKYQQLLKFNYAANAWFGQEVVSVGATYRYWHTIIGLRP